jgi:hypothetical protein
MTNRAENNSKIKEDAGKIEGTDSRAKPEETGEHDE